MKEAPYKGGAKFSGRKKTLRRRSGDHTRRDKDRRAGPLKKPRCTALVASGARHSEHRPPGLVDGAVSQDRETRNGRSHRAVSSLMKQRLINDAQHWRDRAEEVRTQAEHMNDAEARMMMLGIAESYEKLARSADNHAEDVQ